MDLAKINEIALLQSKENVKLCDLELNKPYSILNTKIVNTRFGRCGLVELQTCNVYLPKRVTNFLEENLEEIKDEKYSLIYRGQKQVNRPNAGFLFEILKNN